MLESRGGMFHPLARNFTIKWHMCQKEKEDMSSYTEGQIHQLADALEAAGFTPSNITKLGQLGEGLNEIKSFLEGVAEMVMKKLLTLTPVTTVFVPAIEGKKTRDCFKDKSIYRDVPSTILFNWLPEEQSEQREGWISIECLNQRGTLKQATESFLGLGGDVKILSRFLREKGVVTTLPVIESLIERQEAGEDVGLKVDGRNNFFIVENKDGELSVIRVMNYGGWAVGINPHLDDDYVWSFFNDHIFFSGQTL